MTKQNEKNKEKSGGKKVKLKEWFILLRVLPVNLLQQFMVAAILYVKYRRTTTTHLWNVNNSLSRSVRQPKIGQPWFPRSTTLLVSHLVQVCSVSQNDTLISRKQRRESCKNRQGGRSRGSGLFSPDLHADTTTGTLNSVSFENNHSFYEPTKEEQNSICLTNTANPLMRNWNLQLYKTCWKYCFFFFSVRIKSALQFLTITVF